MLADLDRPIETVRFDPWDRDISLRAMSASQFVEIMRLLSEVGEDDTAARIAVFSKICSYGISDPAYSAEEWTDGAKLDTLVELGNRVLAKTNQIHNDEAKKN